MIETSNSQEPVESTGLDAASTSEPIQETEASEQPAVTASEAPAKELSLKEKIAALKGAAPVTDEAERGPDGKFKGGEAPVVVPEAPKYEANFKYKAFGKEKELDELFRPLIKDADTEKKVKDVFTRADAFDDMKGRYENASTEHQKVLQQFTSLDRDVRRVTQFLNKGDLDNFFQSVRVSDDMLFNYLQQKAEIAKMGPLQQQQYQQAAHQRAEHLNQQESYEALQSNYANQQVNYRTMQLDMVLSRPEVNSAASGWDQKMGNLGSFRNLVIEEAANHYRATQQDLPAEQAVQLVLNKFGKWLDQAPPQAQQAQAQAPAQGSAQSQAPQAPGQTVVVSKPVIPNVNGRGTSPIKQAPKSIADLRAMGKQLREAESAEF